jgi:beta-glucosidase
MKLIFTLNRMILLIVFMCLSVFISAQTSYPFRDKSLSVEQRLNDLVGRMTLEEKIDLLGGYQGFYLHPCERLGIPAFKMADGPLGIASWGLFGRATAFPSALSLAASWDRNLAAQAGDIYGMEWRARGINFLLSPGVNIYRSSKDSRNFEYFGEDPYLTSELVVPFIRGIQNRGVIATIKHFVGNDQEFDRYRVSTEVSKKALQEIYFPAFKAAVQKAGVKAVMAAYNPLNGVYCSENRSLIKDVLEKDWGFKGMVMSDWGATHSTLESALNGLDLVMGGENMFSREKLLPLIKEGKVSEDVINEKVRRIYGPCIEMGFFDRDQLDTSIPTFNPMANQMAFNMAREGIILLKNRGNLLPLKSPKVIAVIGPNATPVTVTDRRYNVKSIVYGGGGSSKVNSWYTISDLDGLMQIFPNTTILYNEGISNQFTEQVFDNSIFTTSNGQNGLEGKYYSTDEKTGKDELVLTRTDKRINFEWGDKSYLEPKLSDDFKIVWEGSFTPQKSDSTYLFVNAQGAYRLWVDNQLLMDASTSQSADNRYIAIQTNKGEKKNIKLEYLNQRSSPAEIRLGYAYKSDINFDEAKRIAAKADVVIFSGGIDGNIEKEGQDRPFELPFGQDLLINELAKANPNTIVVLHGGGGLDMSKWVDKVPAILHTLYYGQGGGKALAEIISGMINPSAKLPFSIEKTWKDSPAYGNYDETRKSKKIFYNEGIFVGYRGFDKKQVEPLFPFGFGLSYSTFEYSNLAVNVTDKKEGKVNISFDITNTSEIAGAEVAELYIHPVNSKAERAYKELKGFQKVWLRAGEKKSVELTLSKEDFQYFSTKKDQWVFDKGKYDILIGTSSKDIKLKKQISF